MLLEAFLREFAAPTPATSESSGPEGVPPTDTGADTSAGAAAGSGTGAGVGVGANGVPNVALYILTSAYHSDADFQARIDSFVATLQWNNTSPGAAHPSLPPVRLLPSGLSNEALVSLYGGADCFVLPSRGEGWGRPHAEAMAMALPVIATHWSGPSHFMSESNSFPLRHDSLVEIAEGAFRGHRWAEPSRAHLRSLMRSVVSDPAAARERGRQARRDMVEKYCPACVARLVVAELARIQNIARKSATAELEGQERSAEPGAATSVPAAPAVVTAAAAAAPIDAGADADVEQHQHEDRDL